MLKVLICCGAGMSSSYLTQKLQNTTKERGLENEVWFEFYSMGLNLIDPENTIKEYDVALCCPHLVTQVKEICKRCPDLETPMHIFPPKMYGMLPFDEVVQEAKDVIEKFQQDHINPVVFPGEDRPLAVKRGTAWSNTKH